MKLYLIMPFGCQAHVISWLNITICAIIDSCLFKNCLQARNAQKAGAAGVIVAGKVILSQ